MNFINRIFRSNMVECPRCLGKGKVNQADIERLKKELYWAPGKCAYCNGIGKVTPDRIEKLPADFEYLTVELSSWERNKVVNGNEEAHKRAANYKEAVQQVITEIEQLYYIKNMEPDAIADHFFRKAGHQIAPSFEKKQFVNYVETVIKSKLKK